MITKEEIINYVENRKFVLWNSLEKHNKDMYDFLIENGKGRTLKESYYLIKENLSEIPICECCGKYKKFNGSKYRAWSLSCGSSSCQNEIRMQHIKEYNIKHFGVEHTFQRKDCKQNIGETKLKRHGSYYWSNSEKTKDTWNEKSEYEIQKILDKSKQTCMKKYGVDNPAKSEIVKNKTIETYIRKYGVDHPAKTKEFQNKIKDTCKEKYGVDRYQKTEEFKELLSIKMSSDECLEKRKQTCRQRYGVDNVMQVNEFKDKMFNSCRKNGSFGPHSKLEDKVFKKLQMKFDSIERQYKDNERYPFACDFYIPSLDLFIECQFHPTHGDHPFNKNSNEDNKLFNKIKNNYEIGDPSLETWAVRDPLKRETAKKNKLNYLEFFSMKEFNEWFKNI